VSTGSSGRREVMTKDGRGSLSEHQGNATQGGRAQSAGNGSQKVSLFSRPFSHSSYFVLSHSTEVAYLNIFPFSVHVYRRAIMAAVQM
jgi:lipocalin